MKFNNLSPKTPDIFYGEAKLLSFELTNSEYPVVILDFLILGEKKQKITTPTLLLEAIELIEKNSVSATR